MQDSGILAEARIPKSSISINAQAYPCQSRGYRSETAHTKHNKSWNDEKEMNPDVVDLGCSLKSPLVLHAELYWMGSPHNCGAKDPNSTTYYL